MILLMGWSLCQEFIYGVVADVLLDSSCITNGLMEDTASKIFVGFDDDVVVIVVKLLCKLPLAWC